MNSVVRAPRGKNILCVRAGGDCKAIRHAPFLVAFYCCSRSGIVQMDSGGTTTQKTEQDRDGARKGGRNWG